MNHRLVIREVDRKFFQAIKDGEKTIDTRAATEKHSKINEGDILIFTCGSDRIEKKVTKVSFFKSIEKMFGIVEFKKIMPFVSSKEEAEGVYYSFPNYREKIAKFGLVALELEK